MADIRAAMKRVFVLGQTYWQDADSDSRSAWKRSDRTLQTVNQLIDETCASADQDARDAARYRYLRNRVPNEVLSRSGPNAGVWIDCDDDKGRLTLLTGDDADAAIDADIARRKG